MKKKLTVKQKHRYTKESNILFSGITEYQVQDHHTRITYLEDGSTCKVTLDADENKMVLERIGNDILTKLSFINSKPTMGTVKSEYGTIDVEVYTHKYIKTEDVIAVEYDILMNDEVTDGYRIIWNLREGQHESN